MPSPIRRFTPNPTGGRDIAVGDVHGTFQRLEQSLRAINFEPTRDRLFSVGDLVDRGPESHLVLEWLAQPWFHAVQGNHEAMLMAVYGGVLPLHVYARDGGAWVERLRPGQLRTIANALEALPVAFEVETPAGLVGLVHADCPGGDWPAFIRTLEHGGVALEIARETALWGRARYQALDRDEVTGVRAVVVGHQPVRVHTSLGNVHYIDTKGWKETGHFTLLDLATLQPIRPATTR